MPLKTYLIAFALLTAGMIIGVMFTAAPDLTSVPPDTARNLPAIDQTQSRQINTSPAPAASLKANLERIATLENAVATLEARLIALEGNSAQPDAVDEPATSSASPADDALPAFEALIKAGVDSFTARQITEKQSRLQLARLELRDQALREGYLGSDRYREELQKIREAEVQIRAEVSSSAYDKYLFHTGQNNRVAVESVIPGSNAQQSGIQAGDLILRYEDVPLYNYRDLRSATIEGEKDEIIQVTVLRGENQLTLAMPRGPLGVRLNSTRVNPEDS